MSLLVIDDSRVVRKSLRRALASGGYTEVTEAASAEEAFALLRLEAPNQPPAPFTLILVGQAMPGLDGAETVRRIRADARYRDLPVVMVTSRADEAALQRAHDAGVTEYVRRPFSRVELLARVDTALKLRASLDEKQARERQLAHATRELLETHKNMVRANRRLAGVIEASPAAIFTVTEGGIVESWNAAAERIFGWTADEVIGKPLPFLSSEEDPQRARIRAAMQGGTILTDIETRKVRKDGQPIDLLLSVAPIDYATGVVVVAEDITQRKRAEEEIRAAKERLAAIIDQSPIAIYAVDADTNIVRLWNPAAERLYGWSAEEVIGRPLPTREESAAGSNERHRQVREAGGRLTGIEGQRRRKDGTLVDVSISVALVPAPDGGPEQLLAFAEDITERKRMEAALRRTNRRLGSIIQASPMAIYTVRSDMVVETWNPAAERIFGWKAHEVVGRRLPILPTPDPPETPFIRSAMAQGEVITNLEVRRLRKDGTLIDVLLSMAPLEDGAGQVAVAQDITERKRTERALQEVNARLNAIIQASPAAIYTQSLGRYGTVATWNAAAERIFGWKAEEIIGRKLPMLKEQERREHEALFAALSRGEVVADIETQRLRKDGSIIDVSLSAAPLKHGSMEIVSVVEDITQRKQTERALQSAHDRLRTLVNESPIAIYALRADTMLVTLWNPAAERLFGWRAEEVVGQRLPTVPEGETVSLSQVLELVRQQRAATGVEVVRMRKDGARLELSLSLALVPSRDGAGEELLVFVEDITHRKQAERELLRSREEYRLLVDHATDIVYRTDLEGRFSYVNPAVVRMLGYRPDELIGQHFTQIVRAEYRNRVRRFYLRQYAKRQTASYLEFPVCAKNGDVVWVGQNVTLVVGGDGQPQGFQAIVRDVSEHRANEVALHQMSLSDPLTGVGNRRCFDDFLDREWRRAARERTTLALIMCDVDNFKSYNDTYGHLAGDRVLQAVAAQLAQTVRRPADLVTRYGGEEFAILLPNTSLEGALQRAEQARAAVEGLGIRHSGSPEGVVTLSMGVAALAPVPGSNPALLVQAADEALYAAKRGGRNRVAQHLPEAELAQLA